jgi:hypothetical protein
MLASSDRSLVRTAETELGAASVSVHALEGGIGLGSRAALRQLPPFPSGIACLVGAALALVHD